MQEQVTPVLDYGFVRLVDSMGDDEAIVAAARQSYGKGTKKVRGNRGLIRYLMRNRHDTPFESVEVSLQWRTPIFVARQIMRHRLFSYNEISGRYSELEEEFYLPEVEQICYQSTDNKQGRSGPLPKDEAQEIRDAMYEVMSQSFWVYRKALDAGVARETARMVLPLATFTTFGIKGNLRTWLHLLHLRMDPHAQWETQQFANASAEYISKIAPAAYEAWEDYTKGAVTLSARLWRIVRRFLSRDTFDREMTATGESSDFSDGERDEAYRRMNL